MPIIHGHNFAVNTVTGEKIMYEGRKDSKAIDLKTCTINLTNGKKIYAVNLNEN